MPLRFLSHPPRVRREAGALARGAFTIEHGRHARRLAVLTLAGAAGACAGSPSVLRPAGEGARQLAVLGWWLLGAAATVTCVVTVLVLLPLRRRGPSLSGTPVTNGGDGTRWLVIGSALSLAVLAAVFVGTLIVLGAARRAPAPPALTIEVSGRQWWWEIRYPARGSAEAMVTANEIHVPVGVPVRLRLSSADVIHSFWVPELQGKIDLVPGQANAFWLEADHPGRYRGQCAEYCGRQHARMALYVIAEPGPAFEAWLERQRRPAALPRGELAERGRGLVATTAGCALCYTVRGVAEGRLGPSPGPDLTHVGSRGTLAAGTLPNTARDLAAWIENPPALKPGTQMPRLALDAESVKAIVSYLEQLR